MSDRQPPESVDDIDRMPSAGEHFSANQTPNGSTTLTQGLNIAVVELEPPKELSEVPATSSLTACGSLQKR